MSNIDKQALRERYSEKPAPKCHICGAVMTIQRAGSGGVVYGCTGRIDKDGEGYKFEAGRDFADDHYARSRVTDYSPSGDPDVLELLDELEATEKSNTFLKGQLAELANFNPDWDKLEASYESWREIAAELLVAKDRIDELTEFLAHVKKCLARNGEYAPLSHEEIDTLLGIRAAGIITKVGE
ncbi:ead/Ea22-like family protein [Escherichia coli]|nr:ead/Ea22-like family protein [Escherichia coli]